MFWQVESGPDTTGAGVGMMVTVSYTTESQPKEEVCVKVMMPCPGAAQRIKMELAELDPSMVPPVTDHA